ncbi:MAG: Hpt domain-containing protein [Treponema sp.]|nr:Hpt domain-containing protein [Treponema sp.]
MAEYLDENEGLSFLDGDKDLYKMLLDAYVTENKFDPNALKALVQKRDFEAAAKIVHKTKGASYQIGATKIGGQAQELEDILRSKVSPDASQRSPEEMDKLANDFCDSYQKCLEEVSQALKNY